ncbi:hypothetical protein HG536_0E02630 [Torulaspora globosa]|uniref:non-specific serine/threonine protein kinase n=1 Tax=Torulaspora globosa TaxID=48254 RepID=A0A7G3ZIL6_9SACH|nr:uncharacterized protein HG536_0E02630 [Torulaspora globosa]QLL33352.1 hypothetical protein HG536_0E02630 [Torulaspora globosa]
MSLDYEVYKEGGLLNDRYQKIEDISEGSYGYVSLAKDIERKKLVAVKFIFKLEKEPSVDEDGAAGEEEGARDCDDVVKSANSSVEKRVQLAKHRESMISSNVRSRLSENICFEAAYEIEIQRMIGNEHRNVVKLLDFFDSYIILEYCSGGDLYEAIKGDLIPRKTREITHILTQIIEAIQYVHSKGIYHRDVKPENILISNLFDWTIKLSDWGLATTHPTSLDRSVGSERYMAPELFESNLDLAERKEPYQCDKVDVWSIGIVFLNIVFSKNPFSVANQTDKAFCYFAANREALFDVFSTMSLDFFQVLRYSLTIDPANRDLKKMRRELDNLSEYTLDDEYYNSLQDNDVAIYDEEPRHAPAYVPPSSAPAPVSLPTPPSSSTGKNGKRLQSASSSIPKQTDSFVHAEQNIVDKKSSPIAASTTNGKTEEKEKERARSVPKFKFRKRSHVQRNDSPNQNQPHSYANGKTIKNRNYNHYNNFSHFGNNYNYNQKNYFFNGADKPKIVKHSRKPLGIPTPNTYINNYFNDYHKNKEQHGSESNDYNGFNTRDFFTPPSVNNRYMEGIFSHNYVNKHNNNNNNNNNSSNNNNNNNNTNKNHYFPQFGTSGSKGKQPRRPSSGNRVAAPKTKNPNTSTTSTSVPAYHSPGKYIPPNVRNHYTNQYQSHVPNISAVLDTHTYHEQYANADNGKNETTSKGDLDDVLFTLEESDDFLRDINDLSLHDAPVSSHGTDLHGALQNDLPDLLKSPEPPRLQLTGAENPFAAQILNGGNDGKPLVANQHLNAGTSEHKYKPGIYVPPHHRKSFSSTTAANEVTLSVGQNMYDYSALSDSRRPSASIQQYQAPFMPSLKNHSTTTTALQDKDVFAQTDNDAIIFSEDESDDNGEDSRGMKTVFGPYTIYNNGEMSYNTVRAGRKSSTVQSEAVGSLEQYKNNWLMLQQQQD